MFGTAATGAISPKTNAALTYNSATADFASTTFTGALVGNADTATTAATVTTAAQPTITSVGTLTTLQVDNLNVNGNTVSSTTGALNLTPVAGSAVLIDGAVSIDAGVVTGATSITSTNFVGAIDGVLGSVTPAAVSATTVSGTGVVLTTDATDSTSGSTGSIHTAGGLGVAKALYVGTTSRLVGAVTADAVVSLDDTTDSTSGTTGSIHTDGGLGVAKDIFCGGEILGQKGVQGTASNPSTTSVDFTGIPTWVRKITIMLNGISKSGSSDTLLIRLGDTEGFESTGYTYVCTSLDASPTITSSSVGSGHVLTVAAPGASDFFYGKIVIQLLGGFTWLISSSLGVLGTVQLSHCEGSKSTSAALDRVQLTCSAAETIDSGTINIHYE